MKKPSGYLTQAGFVPVAPEQLGPWMAGFVETAYGEALLAMESGVLAYLAFIPVEGTPAGVLSEFYRQWPEAAEASALTEGAVASEFAESRYLVRGTPFQIEVWQRLLRISVGSTLSYGELACEVGRLGAARAVGGAVGANSIAWAVPCHRVLPASGASGHYRWGGALKARMLNAEAAGRIALEPRILQKKLLSFDRMERCG